MHIDAYCKYHNSVLQDFECVSSYGITFLQASTQVAIKSCRPPWPPCTSHRTTSHEINGRHENPQKSSTKGDGNTWHPKGVKKFGKLNEREHLCALDLQWKLKIDTLGDTWSFGYHLWNLVLGKNHQFLVQKWTGKAKWSSSVRALEVDLFRLIWKTKSSAFVDPWPSRDEPLQPSYFYHLSKWPCDIQTETSLTLIQSNHQPPVACCHCQEWLHRTAAQGLFCVTFWDPVHDQTDE